MAKKALTVFLSAPIQRYRRAKAGHVANWLASQKSPNMMAVGNALYETLNGITSDKERVLMTLIEQRRSLLSACDEQISVIDYGAGSPKSARTEQEMMRGVRMAVPVSTICGASKPQFWAMLLFKLIRKLRPASCVELGTCVGISGSYLAAALGINGRGRLWTLEGAPEIAKIATETFATVGLQNVSVVTGPFHETFGKVLEIAKPVDFLFNDGHHDHDAVIRYFNMAAPFLSENALVVFDDISWSSGMRKAWREVECDERVSLSVDFQVIGIAFVTQKSEGKKKFRIPL